MKRRRYYHASPARFKVGDRISASSSAVVGKNYNFSGPAIYLTTSPYIHFTVVEKAVAGKWMVYEVEPINPKKVGRGIWDEFVAEEVEVIRKIGRVTTKGQGLAKYTSGSERTRTGFKTILRKQDGEKKLPDNCTISE